MNKIIFSALLASSMVGCATTDPAQLPVNSADIVPSTFTYLELKSGKDELWMRARNYIATVYGDSKSVLRVEDKAEGVLVGKGLVSWKMLPSSLSPICHSEYQIRFVAKNQKARLQLELLEGTPVASKCSAWTLPSGYGYEQVEAEFKVISQGLENALGGTGKIDSMSDF